MVTQNLLRTHEGKKRHFPREKIRFVPALELIKGLEQIKLKRLLLRNDGFCKQYHQQVQLMSVK